VGVGAVEPGIVGLTVGTSGVVFATTPSALIEPEGRLHAFCHAVPGMWHFMGVMLSAAGSLQWYRDTLAPNMSFDDLLKEAESIPAGSEGLQFLPYLSGERTPHPDPLARGAFIGLTLRHSRGHMTRAVLEGVAFGLKDSFTLIQNAGLGSDHTGARIGRWDEGRVVATDPGFGAGSRIGHGQYTPKAGVRRGTAGGCGQPINKVGFFIA
jgi:xylulokinase